MRYIFRAERWREKLSKENFKCVSISVDRACLWVFSPSCDTSAHSGLGNSYWPILILLFIPGEMAWPVLE